MAEHGGTPAPADPAAPAEVPSARPGPAGTGGAAPARPASRWPRWPRWPTGWRARALAAAVLLAVGSGLFLCYVTVSRTVPITSDGAGNALQAWSMLHGNWLLQGWWLSDVSFYTTELPEYALVETVRGLTPDVVHVAAGLTYTLLVLGAAWLAKGRARGWAAAGPMLLAGGIMLAPQAGAVKVLLLAPDHAGSAVPALAVLLLLDRAPPRWWVPVLTGVVLAWALVADAVLAVTAVLPLLAVCAGRVLAAAARHERLRSRWLELSLMGAAVAAVGLSRGVLALIAAHGGFMVWPTRARLVPWSQVLTHLRVLPQGLALLFGVSTTSHAAVARGLALVHLAGLGLAIWGLGAALWRFRRLGLVDQLLASAVVINLLAYIFFTPGTLSYSARDYAAVLPLSAALAGRMAGGRLLSARLAPVTAAVLAVYALSLVSVMSAHPVPPRTAHLARWLAAHHLDYGLGAYGAGNDTTLAASGHVHVVVVVFSGGRCYPLQWEAQAQSFDARLHNATFIVQAAPSAAVDRVFGVPGRVYHVGGFRVLVWHTNLLRKVHRASSRHGAPHHHAFLPGGL